MHIIYSNGKGWTFCCSWWIIFVTRSLAPPGRSDCQYAGMCGNDESPWWYGKPGKPVKWGDMKSEITIEFSQKQWCVRLKRILWEGDRRCSSYFIYTSLYLLKECFALKQIELFNCLQSSYNVTNPMKPEDQSILVHPAATWLVLSLPPSIYLSIIF